ncbi:hypothetical protein D3C71_2007650 [compost metagenome]
MSYVRSYDEGNGNAKRAYQFLARHFGSPLIAVEVVSEEGVGFHRHLLEEGILASINVDRKGFDPKTGKPIGKPSPATPLKP